jgi:DegV family protein with EDD domain
MNDFIIMTDSSCDLSAEMAANLELTVLPLTFELKGKEFANYLDGRELSFKDFYLAIREGEHSQTSAVNTQCFIDSMETILELGKDILCLSFSSGLSTTHNSALSAAEELKSKYPKQKIYIVDTLSASLGQGLLVYLAAQQKLAGHNIEDVRDYVETNKLNLCHWFTVDDLNHLKRGGRVSAATALVGTMLNIKPVMHVDNEGHLVKVDTVRGRKKSLKALVDNMEKTAFTPKEQTVFISHGDCEEEAIYVADMIKERFGTKDVFINYVGPVIGAHSGPGTMALFFLGQER